MEGILIICHRLPSEFWQKSSQKTGDTPKFERFGMENPSEHPMISGYLVPLWKPPGQDKKMQRERMSTWPLKAQPLPSRWFAPEEMNEVERGCRSGLVKFSMEKWTHFWVNFGNLTKEHLGIMARKDWIIGKFWDFTYWYQPDTKHFMGILDPSVIRSSRIYLVRDLTTKYCKYPLVNNYVQSRFLMGKL